MYSSISINCEHCLDMLKETIKSYVVCVIFYRILNYVYLLSISRYIACLGYKQGLSSVLTMNGVTR